jgi:integrase
MKARIWDESRLGVSQTHLFEELAVEFLRYYQDKPSFADKQVHVRHWLQHFRGRTICSLTALEISNAVPVSRKTYSGQDATYSNASKNRYMASLSRMFSMAVELGWISTAPKIMRKSEPKIRVRFLTKDQAQQLVDSVTTDWMRNLTLFALQTGMRAGEMLSLTWQQVDFDKRMAWVTADKAKSGVSRPVPLNETALSVIRRQPKRSDYVFSKADGGQIKQVSKKTFDAACNRAAGSFSL